MTTFNALPPRIQESLQAYVQNRVIRERSPDFVPTPLMLGNKGDLCVAGTFLSAEQFPKVPFGKIPVMCVDNKVYEVYTTGHIECMRRHAPRKNPTISYHIFVLHPQIQTGLMTRTLPTPVNASETRAPDSAAPPQTDSAQNPAPWWWSLIMRRVQQLSWFSR